VIHKLPMRTVDDPAFATVARMVNPPPTEPDKRAFLPAYAGFNIADGSDVDISYYYAPPAPVSDWPARRRFDRHLRTEELWVVTEGDFLLPLAACRNPDDPDDAPRPEDFLCFAIKQGDLFVLRPNVWHCGPWPTREGAAVRFLMMLSGHRKSTEQQAADYVDFIQREFPEDTGILPELEQTRSRARS
jgi:hypothetical protein